MPAVQLVLVGRLSQGQLRRSALLFEDCRFVIVNKPSC